MGQQTAIIIGAGPAGLTAACELLRRTQIRPIVLEQTEAIGGLAQTVNYKGNRMDIGGHRFFSKSDRVMEWWFHFLPLQATGPEAAVIQYQGKSREIAGGATGPDPRRDERVMLLRQRRSRIYYLRKFFEYPIRLNAETLRKLGPLKVARIGLSYLRSVLFKIRDEKNLEDFFINRFGSELYETFFKSYTEKVWGRPCREISAEWGAQRVKGLSVWKSVLHALRTRGSGVARKQTETSLIEQFMYPKFGPGQMWEEVAREVRERGGEIRAGWRVDRLELKNGRIVVIEAMQTGEGSGGERRRMAVDYVFSTMPIKDLVRALGEAAPPEAREIAEGLVYRDFITIGLLLKNLKIREEDGRSEGLIRDNWIYIQEPDVKLGRLQIYNNWSPEMVADRTLVWVGLEYFCDRGDPLWEMKDAQLIELAKEELDRIGIIEREAALDAKVIRMEKAYPAYFGSYDRFDELRAWLDGIENLYLVGRNGMHRYNNQDHSMLAAMVAVDNIVAGAREKRNIWDVNTETEYHETKA